MLWPGDAARILAEDLPLLRAVPISDVISLSLEVRQALLIQFAGKKRCALRLAATDALGGNWQMAGFLIWRVGFSIV